MNILILDTETIGLTSPYVYDIGYVIYDTENDLIVHEKSYIVEQVWHNEMLFNTAYYADKRPIYISALRGKTAELKKFGHIMQKIGADIKKYNVVGIFAYNSPFDDKAIQFTCKYFGVNNPLNDLPFYDIRAYFVNAYGNSADFKRYCDAEKEYTESGNYSTTAQTAYRYITLNSNFIEQHTALSDSKIELEILKSSITMNWLDNNFLSGCKIPYLIRTKKTTIYIDNEMVKTIEYSKKITTNDKIKFIT